MAVRLDRWELGSPVYRKTMLFIMVPALIVTLLLYITYRTSIRILTGQVRQQTRMEFRDSSTRVEDVFKTMFNLANMISSDKSVIYAFPQTGYSEFKSCVDALTRYELSAKYIDSIYLLDTESGMAISKEGVYVLEHLFTLYYRYQDYPANWYENVATHITQFKIHPISAVSNTFTRYNKRVMPFAFTKLGSMKSGQILLVNVNGQVFNEIFENSGDAGFFIFDENGNLFFSNHCSNELEAYAVDYIKRNNIKDILHHQADIMELPSENGDILVAYMPDYSKLNSYYYLSYVPQRMIVRQLNAVRNMFYLATMVCCLIPVFSFFLSRSLYAPLGRIVRSLSAKDDHLNEYTAIDREIRALEFRKSVLEQDIRFALPYVCEKYILSILYQSDPVPDDKAADFLKSYGIVFEHAYFCTCLTYFRSASKAPNEHLAQKYTFINRIVSTLSDEKNAMTPYAFLMNNNAICSIVNLPDISALATVLQRFKDLSAGHEMNDYEICTGIGNVYRGMSGMYKSFKESEYLLALFRTHQNSGILVFDSDTPQAKYRYTLSEEARLSNCLFTGDNAQASELIRGIVKANMGISESELKNLYFHLYISITRVVKARSLTTQELLGSEYLPFSENYPQMSMDEIIGYLDKILQKTCQIGAELGGHQKVDIKAVQQYIDLHYASDLFLEKFAEQYEISSSYFSRCFKEATGGGFYDYVSTIRIEKAKEMLKETWGSIDTISMKTGFNSRQTFIRMFKKLTGCTPAKYREQHRQMTIK